MNILENGLHSFKKSIKLFNTVDTVKLGEYEFVIKDIVLSLHHSIETLFKYIVKDINELLIYDDITGYCKTAISKKSKENNNKTITFMDAVYRYYAVRKNHVNSSVINSFLNINDYRNALTHHEISFKDKEIEHLIANLLSEIYDVYSKEINGFERYCIDNSIDIDIKIINERYIEWYIKTLNKLCEKICLSMDRVKVLEENPKHIQEIFETIKKSRHGKKENFINLVYCPICEKEAFLKKGILTIGAKEYGYYGKCKFCDIDLKKEDAKFIYDNLLENNIDDFENTFELQHKLFNIFKYYNREISKLVNKEDIKTLKKSVIKDNETIEFLVYNVLIEVLENYMYNYIYDNKHLEDEINEDGEIIIEELLSEDESELINFIEGFLLLDENLYDYLNESEYKTLYYANQGFDEVNLVYKIDVDKLINRDRNKLDT